MGALLGSPKISTPTPDPALAQLEKEKLAQQAADKAILDAKTAEEEAARLRGFRGGRSLMSGDYSGYLGSS